MQGTTEPLTSQKQQTLLALHQVCWDEMTWRRNAGYRTVIIGLAYCGILLALVAIHPLAFRVRVCLSSVMALASIFGAAYLCGNYRLYMAAAARMVKIEQYLGAFDANFLGDLGALNPPERKDFPTVPLHKDLVSLFSVITFAAGAMGTAVAILLM